MEKIDVHCHTTPRALATAPGVDASLDAIGALMARHDVRRTVLLATYFPRRGTGVSNYRMRHWIRDDPRFAMFGSLDFERYFYQGFNELEELAAEGAIHGIKLYPAYQPVDPGSDRLARVAALAEAHGLPLMFHGGVSYDLWKALGTDAVLRLGDAARDPGAPRPEPYLTPADFEAVARAFPGVSVLVSHLCKPFFGELAAALRRTPNLYTDLSGLLDSRRDPGYRPACLEQVRRVLGECGPDRVLFGTDFPVQSHEDSVWLVEEAMRGDPPEDRRKVYFDNAMRLVFRGRALR